MNVALPAVVLFLVLLPGFVVRSRFKRAERTSLDYSPFGTVVTEAVLWACLLHALWLGAAWLLLGRELRLDVLMKLISSDRVGQLEAIDAAARHGGWVLQYFGSLLACAHVAPLLARRAITRWRLDRAGSPLAPLLRFHGAPWYYLLTGADFPVDRQPDLIAVSAVVEIADTAVLYTGILDDFFLDPDGRLDRLVLRQVMRRPLDADKLPGPTTIDDDLARFYPVDGDSFVLRYAEAITLNVQYIKFKQDEAA